MEKVTADPVYRRRFLIKGAVYLLLALIVIQWVIPKASLHLMETNPAKAFILLEVLIFLILILMMLSWIKVLRVGIQCVQQRRYPPKNVSVIRDVEISTDKKAVCMGGSLVILALLGMVMCVYLCVTLAFIVVKTV